VELEGASLASLPRLGLASKALHDGVLGGREGGREEGREGDYIYTTAPRPGGREGGREGIPPYQREGQERMSPYRLLLLLHVPPLSYPSPGVPTPPSLPEGGGEGRRRGGREEER